MQEHNLVTTQEKEQNSEMHTLSWPPTSQTVKLMFLYSTVSTLNPEQQYLFSWDLKSGNLKWNS